MGLARHRRDPVVVEALERVGAGDLAHEGRPDVVAEQVLQPGRHGLCPRARDAEIEVLLGEAQGSQYWLVKARRGASERLAPPRCRSVPWKTMAPPAGMITGCSRLSAFFGVRAATSASLQRWLPGMMSVAPLVSVKASIAPISERLMAGRGRG